MGEELVVEKIENLLKDHAIPGEGNNSWWIDPLMIHEEDGFNPRDYDAPDIKAHIQNLKNAYKNGEYVEPWHVQVKDGKIYVRDGHCRRKALIEAMEEDPSFKVKRIHVIEFRGGPAQQSLLILTSNSGKSLSPLEKGKIYTRLVNYGWSISEIASKVGVSEVTIRQLSEMCILPIFLQDQIQKNKISSSLAVNLFQRFGADESIKIISDILQKQAVEGIHKKITKKMVEAFLSKEILKVQQPTRSSKKAVEMHSVFQQLSGLFENIDIQKDEEVFIAIPGGIALQIIALSDEVSVS